MDEQEEKSKATTEYTDIIDNYIPSENFENLGKGDIINGRIIHKDDEYIYLDIGYKIDGIIKRSEFSEELLVGTELRSSIVLIDEERGIIELSHKQAVEDENWQTIIENYNNDRLIDGEIMRSNGNRFIVFIKEGVNGILERRDIHKSESEDCIGKKLTFKIIKVNSPKKEVHLSRILSTD